LALQNENPAAGRAAAASSKHLKSIDPVFAIHGVRRSIAAVNQRQTAWQTASRRKDALPGNGRRANEKADLPLVGNDDGIGLGRGGSQLHDHNHRRGHRHGHHRVHHDAQLAVIGVGLVGVQVRNLGYGQHCQQNQAKHRHRRHKAGPGAALPEPL